MNRSIQIFPFSGYYTVTVISKSGEVASQKLILE
jgi:hypothetical protein